MMSVRRLQANQTSRHVRTRHVRHIFMPDDQTNQKLFISRKQFILKNTQANQASHHLDFQSSIFFLPLATICAVQTPNLVTLWTSIS